MSRPTAPSTVVFRATLRTELTLIADLATGASPRDTLRAWADTAFPTDHPGGPLTLPSPPHPPGKDGLPGDTPQ